MRVSARGIPRSSMAVYKESPRPRFSHPPLKPKQNPPERERPLERGSRILISESRTSPGFQSFDSNRKGPSPFSFVIKSSGLFAEIEDLFLVVIMVLWVFGYGSLVWNPGFDFDEKIVGFIKDYRRVFDLACIDHRGTPENPARTCTLEAKEGAVCWGTAYCIRGDIEKERAAVQYLERRECEYDQKTSVDFYKEEDTLKPAVTGVLVFISTPDKKANKYYLGPASLEETARQIATASGPCGNNRDYLFLLEKAMFNIGHEDDYVIELANEVRKVLGRLKEKVSGVPISWKPHKPLVHPLDNSSFLPADMAASIPLSDMVRLSPSFS